MATDIFPTTGIALQVQKGSSSVQIEGLTDIFANAQVPAFITDIDFEENDVTLPIVALDDQRILYSFGRNFGKATISGLIYLFGCNKQTDILQKLYQSFNQKRTASSSSPSNLSLPGGLTGVKVYPVLLKFYNTDSKFQYVTFAVSCLVAPVTNKG